MSLIPAMVVTTIMFCFRFLIFSPVLGSSLIMPTIKVIINGSHKLKVKTSARKAKDIKLDCPDPLLSDTIAFFKAPESLILTEDNVAFLTGQ